MTKFDFQNAVLITQIFSVFGMTAVIWVVQLVIYPGFLGVGETEFPEFHAKYSAQISFIVIPLMLAELVSVLVGVVLFWQQPHFGLMATGAALTLLVWLVTFLVQVPQHTALSSGYSVEIIRSLVWQNWTRTTIWSIHSIILLWVIWQTCRD